MADWFEPVKKDTNKTQSNEKWFTPSKYYDPAKVLKGVTPLYTIKQQEQEEVEKNIDDYARKATAGDGFENYSLEELKKLVDEREKQYKDMTNNGVQRTLNRVLGIGNAGEKEYKDAKEAYNNRLLITNAALYPHKIDFNSKSAYDNSINDLTYLKINNLDKFKEDVTLDKYRDISENEIKVYNYIYKTEGKKSANQYLSALENTLKNRAVERENTEAAEFADKHPIVASAKSIGTNVAGALEQGGNMVKYLATGDMDVNRNSMLTSTTRGKVMEKVNWEIGNWDAFDFIYGTAMSAADSMLAAPAGTAGAVMLGLSAAGQASNDILQRGGTNEQAFWTGLAAGVFESLFEKISIGNFNALKETAPDTVKTLIKNIAKSMLVNASEESATEIANITYDSLANADISQYQQLVSGYLQEGYSKLEAEKKAVLSLAGQVVEAGAGGALMGLGMGGVGSVTGYLTNRKANNTTANTQTDTVNSENKTPDLQSTAKADNTDNAVFHEPERADIAEKLDPYDKYKTKENGYQVKDSRQRHIERVTNKLGAKITWSEDVKRGKYIPSERRIVLNPNMKTSEMYNFVFKHEFTHYLEGKKGYTDFKNYVFEKSPVFEKWARERLDKNGIGTGSREEIIKRLAQVQYEAYRNSDELSKVMRDRFTMNDAEAEVLADFVGENLLGTGDRLEQTLYELGSIEKKHRGIIQRIRDFISDLIARYRNEKRFGGLVKDLEYLNERLKRVAESADKKISDTETEKYSFAGYAEDGKGKYNSNFPKGTPKAAKAEKILSYIQDIWSKKPIKLNITDNEGNVIKTIDAHFDPTYDESGNIPTDASKLMGGNRHGTAAEQRVTLDLADDYYQIAAESKYNYSKAEKGKDNPAHKDVTQWHYFVNDIYFSEYGSEKYEPYRVSINVKEKPDGNFVYSFSAEKQKEHSTHQTLHADVNNGDNSAANAKLFKDIISKEDTSVNTSISDNSENDTGKNSIAVLPADELLDKYDRGEITREEYLKQTDSMTRRAALEYVQKWERENGAILNNQRRLEEERTKAVELEREEQQMRKDRESNIGAIRRTVRKLDHALRANTNAKHIPEAYKNVVGSFCKLFVDNDQATFEHKELADIYSYYSSLKGDDNNADAPQYDPYIDELLKSLIDTLSGKKLTELNSFELNQVRTVTDALNYTVDHEAQVFIDGKKAKYEEVGRAALNDIESAEPIKLTGALKKESAEKIREFFYEGNMLPEYFLKRMGGTFEKAFKGLADGQNKWARNMEISRKFVEDVKSKYDYNEWKDTTVSFRTESGANVEITIDQAMQLVATAQRERSNNGQRAKHLSVGGVVIDTEAINKAMKKQGKSKEDIAAAWDSLSNRAIQITFEDVDVISKMLTEAQKGYIKDFVDFLSTQCAVWGNEVTMEQYGYRQFNESNYFPYVSSELFLTKDPAKAESTILRRASFTHSLQKNANNPLVLTSFTDIALQHMESMCNFNAMTVPLETLNKIFNYKTESGEGTAPRSVKAEMKNIFGSGAVDYMQNLIKDLNTGVRGDQRDSFLNKMTSLFKKNAVLANLSVIFQQPTAIIRAGSDMKGKYFAKAAKYFSKNNYEECKQYAPVAVIKQMGRFDTGVGVKNTTWLSGEQTIREKADDFLGWGAGKADEIAWSYLWSSVKAEIADTTDLKVGSEEFLTKAGERFTELVNKTQVYDSVLTKSQNMRNKGLVGSITSFMAEPTVALNMVVNSFLDFNEGKISGKKFSRIIMSVATAEIVTAMMQSLVTAARDDDEDKSYLEKYLKNIVSNSLSNFNLAGKIPYIRDIMSKWEGYDVERGDISAISDLIKAIKTLTNENKTVPEKIRRISEALAALFGVPLKNIDRDIEAIAKTIYGFAFGEEKTDADGLKVSALEGVSENNILKPFGIEFFDFSKTGEYERMAEAAKRGDEKTYSESYNRLIENGTEDSDIRTGITKQFKNDKTVKKQSEQYVKELKQNDTFNSFTDEDKEKLTGQVSSALAKEAMVKATEREPDEYDKLYELYRTNKTGYNKRKKEMLAEGKTEKQINDGLELAKYAYLQSKGIDLHEYLLYKMATSKKYADKDDSGGVSKAEKKKAVENMDVDEKTRRQIREYLLNNNF